MEFLTNMFFWGLSYDDIVSMFALTEQDLQKKILDCMGAPSSFNAIAHQKGQHVVSCNDVYGCTKKQIETKMSTALDQTMLIIKDNVSRFVASAIGTPKEFLGKLKENLKIFLDDYGDAQKQKRYSPESLPEIDFADKQFDLAICRHFLFARNSNFTIDFQVECVKEMCRVADEARIFPLLDAQGKTSEKLEPLMQRLQELGYNTKIQAVSYELQQGGDTMLVVTTKQKQAG